MRASLPALEAKMRAQARAYFSTLKDVLHLRAAEPPPPHYGKAGKRPKPGNVAGGGA